MEKKGFSGAGKANPVSRKEEGFEQRRGLAAPLAGYWRRRGAERKEAILGLGSRAGGVVALERSQELRQGTQRCVCLSSKQQPRERVAISFSVFFFILVAETPIRSRAAEWPRDGDAPNKILVIQLGRFAGNNPVFLLFIAACPLPSCPAAHAHGPPTHQLFGSRLWYVAASNESVILFAGF